MYDFYPSYRETLEAPTSHKDCLWPEDISWTHDQLCKFKVIVWRKYVIPVKAISCYGKKWSVGKIWHKDCLWPVNMS